MEEIVERAIRERRVVKFVYDKHPRVAEPHVYGIKNDKHGILAYQIGGSSSSGKLDWRRFYFDKISGMEITDEGFPGPRPYPSGKHSEWDTVILVVEKPPV